jgi:hypothetical protein
MHSRAALFSAIARDLLSLPGFDGVFAAGRLVQGLARLVYTKICLSWNHVPLTWNHVERRADSAFSHLRQVEPNSPQFFNRG